LYLSIITIGCKKEHNIVNPDEEGPFRVEALVPLPDNIPYEQLGSGKILLERFYGNGESMFYVIDIDEKKSTGFKLESSITQPSISPSGTKIACSLLNSSEPGTPWNIHIMNIDGTDCFPANVSDQDASFPSWNSDGSKIIYSTAGGGIFTQSPLENSSDRVEMIKFQYSDDPDWEIKPFGGFSLSLSGMLTGVSTSETLNGLVGIEPYTGKAGASLLLSPSELDVQLLRHTIESPVFSPDGSKIAFIASYSTSPDGISLNIYMIDADGSNLVPAAGGGGSTRPEFYRPGLLSLCWSPDGRKILFTFPAFENDGLHLYVANIDGSGFYQVTNQAGAYDTRVSWCK
jgi:Tol biopolymer transport system component